MEHHIIAKILKEGINFVDLSMLDGDNGKRILIYVAEKLYKLNKISEAVTILEKAREFERLKEMGDELMAQNKGELAALCYIPTKDKDRLNNAALLCLKSMNYKLAAKAYESAGNLEMANFLLDNYC